jgi:hypothetical protein
METVEIPIVNKAITNVVARPYHHNGQILLNQGPRKKCYRKRGQGVKPIGTVRRRKKLGKNQNGGVGMI